MGYSPKHNYRAKDHLERGDPDKKVMGRELSEDFEAISADIKNIRQEIIDGADQDGLTLNELEDVNADPKTNTRDDLLIWNGTNWVADDFAFIQTALSFKGGIAPTANAPNTPEGGDLYVFDADGTLNASWGVLSGTPVVSGKFVGYAADTHNRWYLLGDMAEIGVMEVSPGAGIDVDDSKPSEPVVSIDRAEVDTWYADKQDTEDRFVDIEGNITQIEGDITNIENNLAGNYEPKIDPKNNAFNKNFGTTSGTVAQGNHDHNTLYEPIITPKNSAFNKNFGTTSGTVAQGDHNHNSAYQAKGNYVVKGGGGSLTIVVGSTGSDPNTLYFVV